jgi:hypothetical protein
VNALPVSDVLITVLAEGPTNTGPDVGKASPVGLFIVVLLSIAVLVLVWSMNRHLKKARDHFTAIEDGPAAGPAGPAAGPAGSAAGKAATRKPSGEPSG